MSEKLKDYQVIDVFCGGTYYKVKHKVTNNIFAWKAYNCSAYSDQQIKIIANDVKLIKTTKSDKVLRYHDTILHAPSKTLYFVLEYSLWRNIQELIEEYEVTGRHFAEGFIWHLLHELAQVCKVIGDLELIILRKCITSSSVFVGAQGDLLINCFDLVKDNQTPDLMRQVGYLIHRLCYQKGCDDKINNYYSDDLRHVIDFLLDEKNSNLNPDVILYHPTVLANLETVSSFNNLNILSRTEELSPLTSETNKCDAEKVVELSRILQPLPKPRFVIADSPIYCNISPKRKPYVSNEDDLSCGSTSPTLAALALELLGFVPRCRRPYIDTSDRFKCPKTVSEETLSQQWMTRLIALREREDALNRRERHLIVKEIINSPSTKVVNLNDSQDLITSQDSNGITLPPIITHAQHNKREWASRRQRLRASSVRSKSRRKSYQEDLDSSLSADAGDSSMVITAMKFTEANMPPRTIFHDVSTKKVHFTSSNPFVGSDESVTLTFYELENMEENHELKKDKASDISKFKYLNLEKTEKKFANWTHSSPSKSSKVTKNLFGDITGIRKTPSKSSISSQCSTSSRLSMMSRDQWSMDTCDKSGSISERTRSSMRQSLVQTPTALDTKKKSRKSLLHFRTPFKFRSTKS